MTHPYYPSIVPPIEKDRRTGLIVFGIFALVIGGLSACGAIVTPLALLMTAMVPQRPGMPPQQQVHVGSIGAAVVVYAVVAAAFIAGGVGSLRTRRWARPLMLSVAWTWLIIGVFGAIMAFVMARSMTDIMTTPGGPAPPPGFATGLVIVMSVISVLIYLVLPGVFILFYRSPHVRRTLEHYDPEPGWADRAPVSVFGLAVGLGVTALFTLTMIGYGFFPLFGALLTGAPAALAAVAVAAVFGAAAWLVFRLSPAGWWLTMAISVVLPIAMIVSHYEIGAVAMYERMGMMPEQIETMRGSAAITGPLMPACVALLGIAGIVYLLYLRKWFTPTAPPPSPAAAVAPPAEG